MPFTPKPWVDSPSTATPLDAAALIDLETRLAAYAGEGGGGGSVVITESGDADLDPGGYVDGAMWVKVT
jgi:hypothetical protein